MVIILFGRRSNILLSNENRTIIKTVCANVKLLSLSGKQKWCLLMRTQTSFCSDANRLDSFLLIKDRLIKLWCIRLVHLHRITEKASRREVQERSNFQPSLLFRAGDHYRNMLPAEYSKVSHRWYESYRNSVCLTLLLLSLRKNHEASDPSVAVACQWHCYFV